MRVVGLPMLGQLSSGVSANVNDEDDHVIVLVVGVSSELGLG